LPGYETVGTWTTWAAEEDICFGLFVGEDLGVLDFVLHGREGKGALTVAAAQSVKQQIMIIRKLDRTCGIPKMTFVITGQNSENEPAGRRYAIVFFKLSNTTRPYCTASTIAEKDSRRTMSAASIAISEPLPSAIPISAAFKDGASLTPSPVMPTISERDWNSRTIRSFCSGVVRAKTISE
jgi:hypothetical protein